jgi:hypothetical protein
MFVGHLGAGLVLRAYEPRLNAGALILAALFSDILLWILVLGGFEQVHVPADFAARRYLSFTFPWSHGLVATAFWAALGFGATLARVKNVRAAAFVAIAVCSHFVLDWIEHPADLPVLGEGSPLLGFGLWRALEMALLLEFFLAMGGLSFYLVATVEHPLRRRVGMAVLVFAMTAMAIGGQLTSKEAPPVRFVAISSLVTILLVGGIAFVLDRRVSPSASMTSPR